jgi:hypothetical protein
MVRVKLFTPEERTRHAALFRRDEALWSEFVEIEKKCENRAQLYQELINGEGRKMDSRAARDEFERRHPWPYPRRIHVTPVQEFLTKPYGSDLSRHDTAGLAMELRYYARSELGLPTHDYVPGSCGDLSHTSRHYLDNG